MPYIRPHQRREVEAFDRALNCGELNYMITKIINQYWQNRRDYQTINDIVGALDGAKLEFYRRVVVPYEDKKIVENGDVYEKAGD